MIFQRVPSVRRCDISTTDDRLSAVPALTDGAGLRLCCFVLPRSGCFRACDDFRAALHAERGKPHATIHEVNRNMRLLTVIGGVAGLVWIAAAQQARNTGKAGEEWLSYGLNPGE